MPIEQPEHRPLYVAILGFGAVGQGIYNIIAEKQSQLARQLGGRALVVLKVLVSCLSRAGRQLPIGFEASSLLTDSFDDVLAALPAGKQRYDVIFEAMVGEEPANTYLTRALREGRCRCVVTANKVMFAKHGKALRTLAHARQADQESHERLSGEKEERRRPPFFIGFEACVAGGVPVIKTLQNMRRVQGVRKIEGILNGTSNYMLTKMRTEQASYAAALAEAQSKGYAEADPFNDVSGQDAFCKLMIAAEVAFGRQPPWGEVAVVGIDALTEQALADAAAAGHRYRHIACVELLLPPGSQEGKGGNEGEEGGAAAGRIVAAVRPCAVGPDHALFTVDGVQNAVAVHTDYLGCVTLVGPGAGMFPTASVMLEDYLTSGRCAD